MDPTTRAHLISALQDGTKLGDAELISLAAFVRERSDVLARAERARKDETVSDLKRMLDVFAGYVAARFAGATQVSVHFNPTEPAAVAVNVYRNRTRILCIGAPDPVA